MKEKQGVRTLLQNEICLILQQPYFNPLKSRMLRCAEIIDLIHRVRPLKMVSQLFCKGYRPLILGIPARVQAPVHAL